MPDLLTVAVEDVWYWATRHANPGNVLLIDFMVCRHPCDDRLYLADLWPRICA